MSDTKPESAKAREIVDKLKDCHETEGGVAWDPIHSIIAAALEEKDARIVCDMIAQVDLLCDEVVRIDALTNNPEIKGICQRAVACIRQSVPVITQRDEAIKERDTLRDQLAACNGSCDIALARRQVGPDGVVPGNARECAELWEREASRVSAQLAEKSSECERLKRSLLDSFDTRADEIWQETRTELLHLRTENAELPQRVEKLEGALTRKGYRESCDIPACNCGDNWSHGGRAEERLREIHDEVWENGVTALESVRRLKERAEASEKERDEALAKVKELEIIEEGNRKQGLHYFAKFGEVEAKLRKSVEALALILPLAKGYASANRVGSNQAYVDHAAEVLKEIEV